MIIVTIISYSIPLIFMICSLWLFAVLSNIVTGMTHTSNYQLNDNIRNLIQIDNQAYPNLFECVNLLPFVVTILYLVVQIIDYKFTHTEFIIDAMFTEAISMILKGFFQIITILPDANPSNPHCKNPSPAISSINLDSCGNMMMSGHMFHLVFGLYWLRCIFQIHCKDNKKRIIYDVIFFLLTGFETFMIIGLQIHYSIDVFVALLYSYLYITNISRIRFIQWYKDIMNQCTKKFIDKKNHQAIDQDKCQIQYQINDSLSLPQTNSIPCHIDGSMITIRDE